MTILSRRKPSERLKYANANNNSPKQPSASAQLWREARTLQNNNAPSPIDTSSSTAFSVRSALKRQRNYKDESSDEDVCLRLCVTIQLN